MRGNRIYENRAFARVDQYADNSADDQSGETFEIPEDLAELSDADIQELHTKALDVFNGMYGDGSDLTDSDVDTLAALTEGIESVKGELAAREERAAERRARAEELAAKVRPAEEEGTEEDAEESPTDEGEEPAADEEAVEVPDTPEEVVEAESVTASAPAPKRRGPVSVPMARAKRHMPKPRQEDNVTPKTMKDIVFAAGEGSGYAAGQGIDFRDAGKIVDRRLAGVNEASIRAAASSGRHVSRRDGVFSVKRPSEYVIGNSDSLHVEETLQAAASEKRLQGNSLLASGGWCAPSEVIYDLLDIGSRDGLYDVPEVQISRGGITRALPPNFADFYSNMTGFRYTEDQDIAGQYGVDENGVGNDTDGTKPCHRIPCPEFEEYRLGIDGLCLTAGLLQQKGYPEVIEHTVRHALIAHDHLMSSRDIAAVAAASTAVTFPGAEHGVISPLLSAIEVQAEHMRYSNRLARNATIEGVFPYWVRGSIRSDLSRRNGVDLISVTNAQVDAWFAERQISPQYVYDWQDPSQIPASETLGWPNEVSFLLYPAGTWVRGTSDIITLDTLVDSSLLATNDFTALFTEEGRVMIPMGNDSRVITVPDLVPSGITAAQGAMSEATVDLTPEPDPAGE